MMGLALASIVLTIAHGSWLVGEAVAGALYLFCGAVFPLDALPAWLRPVGYLMPVTYWLELVRRALVGPRGAPVSVAGGHRRRRAARAARCDDAALGVIGDGDVPPLRLSSRASAG